MALYASSSEPKQVTGPNPEPGGREVHGLVHRGRQPALIQDPRAHRSGRQAGVPDLVIHVL